MSVVDEPIALDDVIDILIGRPPSLLSAHHGSCCHIAQAWFTSMARSVGTEQAGPPAWIRERWHWGPMNWPVHWCEIIAAEHLDCGALAALALHAVEATGGTALPVQLIQRFDASTVAAWRDSWRYAELPPWTWIDFVYHEAIALLDGPLAAVWDPTSGCWVDGKITVGYASLAAIQINPVSGGAAEPKSVVWNDRSFAVGVWHRMETEYEK